MGLIIQTNCSCGQRIDIELDSEFASRSDGKRPFYPANALPLNTDPDYYANPHLNIFRCVVCRQPVEQTVPELK